MLKRTIQAAINSLGFKVVRLHNNRHSSSPAVRTEIRRLLNSPDFSITETTVLGPPLRLISNHAFVYLYEEIIEREIYRFQCQNDSPFIIDCGANIGLSVIYFKRLYPNARITCFEPAPDVFKALSTNVATFGLKGVQLNPSGVWNAEAELRFRSDLQSTGGHIVEEHRDDSNSCIKVVRLRDYLTDRVDFLKIDIEGAEDQVIPDIADRLHLVNNLFVEIHSRVGERQMFPEIVCILAKAGFRLYMETCACHSKQPFVSRQTHKGMDMLVNVFATRG